jgi:hypothetical protein
MSVQKPIIFEANPQMDDYYHRLIFSPDGKLSLEHGECQASRDGYVSTYEWTPDKLILKNIKDDRGKEGAMKEFSINYKIEEGTFVYFLESYEGFDKSYVHVFKKRYVFEIDPQRACYFVIDNQLDRLEEAIRQQAEDVEKASKCPVEYKHRDLSNIYYDSMGEQIPVKEWLKDNTLEHFVLCPRGFGLSTPPTLENYPEEFHNNIVNLHSLIRKDKEYRQSLSRNDAMKFHSLNGDIYAMYGTKGECLCCCVVTYKRFEKKKIITIMNSLLSDIPSEAISIFVKEMIFMSALGAGRGDNVYLSFDESVSQKDIEIYKNITKFDDDGHLDEDMMYVHAFD